MFKLGAHAEPPPRDTLPSPRRLALWSVVGVIGVFFVLVAFVWPAEKGQDPTGIGAKIGLTQMGRIKLELALEAGDHLAEEEFARSADSAAIATPRLSGDSVRSDEAKLLVMPGDSAHVTLAMRKGDAVDFAWTSDGPLTATLFGDSLNSGARVQRYFRGIEQRSGNTRIEARFDGLQGWHWRNRGRTSVTITLRFVGRFVDARASDSGG